MLDAIHDFRSSKSMHTQVAFGILLGIRDFVAVLLNAAVERLVL